MVEDGTVEVGTVEDGTVEEGTVEEGTVEEGTVEEEMVEEGVTEGFNDILSMMTFGCFIIILKNHVFQISLYLFFVRFVFYLLLYSCTIIVLWFRAITCLLQDFCSQL